METLARILGGVSKVKVMRLFLFNPEKGFDAKDVALRARITSASARRELAALSHMGFLRRGKFEREIKQKSGKKAVIKRQKVSGWFLDRGFSYARSLRDLLIDSKFLERDEILRRFRNGGKVKLLIVSGVFLKEDNSRLDILIVGDSLKRAAIENSLKNIESEIGKELKYAVLDTKEFKYRLDMYDKFVRDVLDYPHERLIEKIRLE